MSGLSWALTWTAEQTQHRSASHLASLLRFHTPAPSSQLRSKKVKVVVGRGGSEVEEKSLFFCLLPLLSIFSTSPIVLFCTTLNLHLFLLLH